MSEDDALTEALRQIVGPAHVLTGDDTASHAVDWTGRWRGHTAAVARPADTGQVQAIVSLCAELGRTVIPQGGNTGLVGGGVPRSTTDGAGQGWPPVVVSTRRLDRVGPVDGQLREVAVGAGATLATVNAAAAEHGLAVGVNLASRGSATIGGMVATNAGGIHVVANGVMRQQVRGLEAVMADGSAIRRMSGLQKDTAGYDLAHVLIGSEGTLAIITEVLLSLVPVPDGLTVALVAVPSAQAAIDLLPLLRRAGDLHAVEFMTAPGVTVVADHRGVSPPLPVPARGCLLLVEWSHPAGRTVDLDLLHGALAGLASVVAQDAADRRRLWEWRERHTEALGAHGVAAKLDLSVPLSRVAQFLEDLQQLAARPPAFTPFVFGHLAEGTLHVNLPRGVADDVEGRVLRLCAEHGGSIAAEHGVGVAKAEWLHLVRSPQELAAMRRIKDGLDPQGLFNPGVILQTTEE